MPGCQPWHLERVQRIVADVMRVPAGAVQTAARIEGLGEIDSRTLAEIATALQDIFLRTAELLTPDHIPDIGQRTH